MKFDSNIFYEMARGLGLVQPDKSGTLIEIPATMNPIFAPRGPFVQGQTVIQSSSFINRGSWHTSVLLDVNAGSGGISTTLATFAKGLWEINLYGGCQSNYVGLGIFEAYVYITEPVSIATGYLLGFKAGGAAAAPVVQTGQRTMQIMFDVDGWLLNAAAVNNAAGQRITAGIDIFVHKLM